MDTNQLIELRRLFETCRRPVGFNYVHFLFIHLYNSSTDSSTTIKTYPLYSIFIRLQRKLHLSNQQSDNQQSILDAIVHLLSQNNRYLTETVEQTHLNINLHPISCLFRLYSPIHLFLFMEPSILSNNQRLIDIIKPIFINEYSKEKCDYIHFSIAHRKTEFMVNIFFNTVQQTTNSDQWLTTKINSPSDRSWLPIHYAAYVGDCDTIEKLCRQYSHMNNPLYFILPKSRMREFSENPFDYLSRASGIKSNLIERGNTVVDIHEDVDDDLPILPLMTDDESDEDLLMPISNLAEQSQEEQMDAQIIEEEARYDADIPDVDQLESSIQYPRDIILRSLVEQAKGLVYFIPSPLLLASVCPLNGEEHKQSYYQIVQHLLESKLVDIDGLNHSSLTKNILDYFTRHRYANFTRTNSMPYIYYQCDALFTSAIRHNPSRVSQFTDDGQTTSKLVYFLTILNQRSLFQRCEQFDQYLLRYLLDLHSHPIENALGKKISLDHYTKGTVIKEEKINDLTFYLRIRYPVQIENEAIEIDVHFYFIHSYINQFVDTYFTLFHTPITVAVQNNALDIVEILLANISYDRSTIWGSLGIYELETCVDQLFTRRGQVIIEEFTKFFSLVVNIPPEESTIQQRIFVHALATCIKYNAKIPLEHLISNYAQIYFDSCLKHPTDVRHNILAYCVVRNQASVLESLISAFSTLNPNGSHLYMLPLSNLSSVSEDSLSAVLNKDMFIGFSTNGNNTLYSVSDDDYRQCRRVRNTAIANQQKDNPNENSSRQDGQSVASERLDNLPRPSVLNFWNVARLLQLSFRHRRQTGQYTRQINIPESDHRRTTTATTLQTIEEDENLFQRANLLVAEPVLNELPISGPLVPQPIFIRLTSSDQEDEQDTTPVTGQTLLHIAAKLPDHEDVVRVLISENANMTSLINSNGQIPLHCAVLAGSTLSAQLLMEADPHSLITLDHKKSSVFHYCCEKRNDVLLASLLNLLRRQSLNQSVRIQALQNLTEPNTDGQTPFSIACHQNSIKCVKQLLHSKWLLRRVKLANLITADGIKRCIDDDQMDIILYLVNDTQRFRVILSVLIEVVFTEPVHPSTDVVVGRRQYNVLEYAILLKKTDFVRIFVSVNVPRTIEIKTSVDDHLAVVRSSNIIVQEALIHDEYKRFLTRYSLPYKHEDFDQTPIQRMLKVPALVPFVPILLDQFLDVDGIDLSVVDDCLCSKPQPSRCIFGQKSSLTIAPDDDNKNQGFTGNQWLQEHPLHLICKCDYGPIYDHPLILAAVDSKAELFGNVLYLFMLIFQALYVALYTGVTIITRTPKYYNSDYVEFENDTCSEMCQTVTNITEHFDYTHTGASVLYIFRFILLVYSCVALLKEFIQLATQRRKYFRVFFLNLLEILTYTCGIIFSIDLNDCSKYTSIRCKFQYDFGALGVASVWTIFLLVFVNALKLGKYGLLFITVFLTFIKFCFIYAFIWIGYLFAFHMLLTQNPAFETILTSIPRMIAMLTGEFNFENLFYTEGERVRGTSMAKVIFTMFVFVVHICVMNILIGLAVSDVNDFQMNAKRENLRSRIQTVLNFQAKFGSICRTSARMMFTLGRRFPQLLTGLNFDVSKLSLRLKLVPIPNRTTNLIQCRAGYVTVKRSNEVASHKEMIQEIYNEKMISKVNEIHEEIHKTQLRFTQELHRLTINLSRMVEK